MKTIPGAMMAMLVLSGTFVLAPRANEVVPAIHVYSCALTVSDFSANAGFDLDAYTAEALLNVRFQNDSTQGLKRIAWRVKYGSGWVTIADDGVFSPGVQIDRAIYLHRRWIRADKRTYQSILSRYQSSDQPENCVVAQTISSNGVTWDNDAIAAQPFALPTKPPHGASQVSNGPIDVISCQFEVHPLARRAFGSLRFQNSGIKDVSKVTARAWYPGSWIDFTIQGKFSPGVFVERVMGASVDRRFPWDIVTLHEPSNCAIVRVQFSDATQWTDPAIDGASVAPIPTLPPNAYRLEVPYRTVNAANVLVLPSTTP